eukprot:g44180.t1
MVLCLTAAITSLEDRMYKPHERGLKKRRMAGWFACTGPDGTVPAARLSHARRNKQLKLYLRNAALCHLPLRKPALHDDEDASATLRTSPAGGEFLSLRVSFELTCPEDPPEPGHYFDLKLDSPVLGEVKVDSPILGDDSPVLAEEYVKPEQEAYGVLDIQDLRPAYQQGDKAISFKELPYTVEAFQEHISRGASVVQLSGHGYSQAGILFESAYTMFPVAVSSARLASMINCGQGLKTTCCVVIMSCDSMAIARGFLEAGVPHVVAIEGAVSDQAARDFSGRLHSRLASGDSIANAFAFSAFQAAVNGALARLEGKDPTAASNFRLMPEDASHDFAPFAEQAKGSWIDLSAKKYCLLPARPRWFEGLHSTELLEFLLRSMKEKRLVCVHGAVGSGKTALELVAAGHL